MGLEVGIKKISIFTECIPSKKPTLFEAITVLVLVKVSLSSVPNIDSLLNYALFAQKVSELGILIAKYEEEIELFKAEFSLIEKITTVGEKNLFERLLLDAENALDAAKLTVLL